jgi:hypothetical protein
MYVLIGREAAFMVGVGGMFAAAGTRLWVLEM